MKQYQRIATQVFIAASIFFGLTGITLILSVTGREAPAEWLVKLLVVLGFVILSSFGVSVGLKYLSDK